MHPKNATMKSSPDGHRTSGCPRPDVEFAESQLAVFFAIG
jgi:hypothetical protein